MGCIHQQSSATGGHHTGDLLQRLHGAQRLAAMGQHHQSRTMDDGPLQLFRVDPAVRPHIHAGQGDAAAHLHMAERPGNGGPFRRGGDHMVAILEPALQRQGQSIGGAGGEDNALRPGKAKQLRCLLPRGLQQFDTGAAGAMGPSVGEAAQGAQGARAFLMNRFRLVIRTGCVVEKDQQSGSHVARDECAGCGLVLRSTHQ